MKRKIEIGKNAGFCGGVSLCVKTLREELLKNKKIYCLGELVHNKDVVKEFVDNGVVVVDSLDEVPDNSNLVIRAHGAEKLIYEQALKRGMRIIDLTCPKVAKIRKKVEEYVDKEDTYIILIAQKNHPETLGTISFCGNNSCVLEEEQDIVNVLNIINDFNNIIIIGQTTFDEKLFLKNANYIKDNVDKGKTVIINNTICNATSVRQEETRRMAKEKEVMIIIGGKNSSNTNKLYTIANAECNNTFWIENIAQLDIDKIKHFTDIGIMAGASTPDKLIMEIINIIEKTN